MDKNLMNKIMKEKEIKFSELPDGFDIEKLSDDVRIIFEEDFRELEDSFWEDED